MPAAYTILVSWPAHFGQVWKGESDIFCRTSNSCPQLLQRYPYMGI